MYRFPACRLGMSACQARSVFCVFSRSGGRRSQRRSLPLEAF